MPTLQGDTMNEHFIKNIEIKNFKCFEDFKAEGFGRVNLIGGKNNVGKTAFMEAIFIHNSNNIEELYKKLLEIDTHRNLQNLLLSTTPREEDIRTLILNNIGISIYIANTIGWTEPYQDTEQYHEVNCGSLYITNNHSELCIFIKNSSIDDGDCGYTYTLSDLINHLDLSLNSTKYNFSLNFISPFSNSNQELDNIIGQSKLDGKYTTLNTYLSQVFKISSIDSIKHKPMLKSNGEYRELSHFGQGIKTFINIISSILLLEDDVIFIDEIDNGIHYTNLDKLWEVILTISKQQNVQVFATTHSKECIESFNRVQLKLKHNDTYSFEWVVAKTWTLCSSEMVRIISHSLSRFV